MNADSAGNAAPLLTMELAAPVPAANMLRRPDLASRLAGSRWKVCLISSPAGWGKTSLLAAWHGAEIEQRPFAFLRLEGGDDDAPIFWT
jgi:LuxR family maltose regulon positive regulatory protein